LLLEQLGLAKSALEESPVAISSNYYSLCASIFDAVDAGDLTKAAQLWEMFGSRYIWLDKIEALADAQRKAREHPPEEGIEIIFESSVRLSDAIVELAKRAKLNIQYDANTLGGSDGQAFLDQTFPQEIRWKGLTASKALLALLDNYGLQMIPNTNTGVARIARKPFDPSTEATDPDSMRIKLDYLEKQLVETQRKQEVGMATSLDVERAKAARDILAAQIKGDSLESAQVKLRLAQKELDVVTSRFDVGTVPSSEVRDAKLARDLAEVALKKEQEKKAAK
jgi:hypothetical protein